MLWIVLVASGLLEAVWALALQASKGFTRLWPSVLLVAALLGSMGGLALAMLEIPTGTAYAVVASILLTVGGVLFAARRLARFTLAGET